MCNFRPQKITDYIFCMDKDTMAPHWFTSLWLCVDEEIIPNAVYQSQKFDRNQRRHGPLSDRLIQVLTFGLKMLLLAQKIKVLWDKYL